MQNSIVLYSFDFIASLSCLVVAQDDVDTTRRHTSEQRSKLPPTRNAFQWGLNLLAEGLPTNPVHNAVADKRGEQHANMPVGKTPDIRLFPGTPQALDRFRRSELI